MLLLAFIALVGLTVYTFVRWETVSPKLLVREAATLTGSIAGSVPVVFNTGFRVAKAANVASELALREAGEEGPLGFKLGRVVAAKYTRDAFAEVNASARASFKADSEALASLKASKASKES